MPKQRTTKAYYHAAGEQVSPDASGVPQGCVLRLSHFLFISLTCVGLGRGITDFGADITPIISLFFLYIIKDICRYEA